MSLDAIEETAKRTINGWNEQTGDLSHANLEEPVLQLAKAIECIKKIRRILSIVPEFSRTTPSRNVRNQHVLESCAVVLHTYVQGKIQAAPYVDEVMLIVHFRNF
eukprot:scaffold23479_cov143-Cylindrotheca_fusiformis.AAC.27